MGGNALKTETFRKTTDEFNKIASEIIPIIESGLNTETFIAKCYHNKETHGDMDILIKMDSNNQGINLIDFINNTFKPNDLYNNNGVVSFDYDEFQIDFIPIKISNWEIAKVWYSYDPFSNLAGKSSHRFGTKYGHGGLVYPFRNFNGRLSKDITLSKDPKRIFEFLGYDYERFQKGFDNLEEIFEYVIDGKYFDYSIFLMENLNHIDRKRNKKRKSYQEFLQYIENKGIKDTYQFSKDKSTYIDLIHDSFPKVDLKGKIEELSKKDAENSELNEKFNGRLIMDIFPELTGKELGNMITNFQKSFGDYREFALKHSTDDIMFQFGKFYQKEKGS